MLLILTVLPAEAARVRRSAPKPVIPQVVFHGNIQSSKTEFKVEKSVVKDHMITLYLEEDFCSLLMDEDYVAHIYDSVRRQLPAKYHDYPLEIVSKGHPIGAYVPNHLRRVWPVDSARYPAYGKLQGEVVRRLYADSLTTQGLQGRNIALWNSHGLYWDPNALRWRWQRPRLHGTAEDLYTTSLVLRYLLPMLENAGAHVYMPRERDISLWENTVPFRREGDSLVAVVTPPEAGSFWLSFRYPQQEGADSAVKVRVWHGGRSSDFSVNETIGGGTWHYLDQLYLDGPTRVVFRGKGVWTVDSLHVGGGMSRVGSGHPRYAEAACYYLRQAGLPDSLVYDQKKGVVNDYYDDIYSRSKWVNYLTGGSPVYPDYPGLGIPMDASLAIHTDAGITPMDSVVATLVLCTSDSLFPSGYSQLASSDFAEYVRRQIVEDVRATVDPGWATRGIWHRQYVETRVPAVPALIVELLSHQNFSDLQRGFDPRFRFVAARAIYKGLLRFLAGQYDEYYTVAPLPVEAFNVSVKGDSAVLSWRPVQDELEETATPVAYRVYTRINGRAYDHGRLVRRPRFSMAMQRDSVYSFRITAVNAGGESFPSEELSACQVRNPRGLVMIVNGFDRLEGPVCHVLGNEAGFDLRSDIGVSDGWELAYTGPVYEFDTQAAYVDNDYPGFGAAVGEWERTPIAGNTFDYPRVHAQALRDLGYSCVSVSRLWVEEHPVVLSTADVVDLILGKQRNSAHYKLLTEPLENALSHYMRQASQPRLLVSGAYLGSSDNSWLQRNLHVRRQAPWAAGNGTLQYEEGGEAGCIPVQPSVLPFVQNADALRSTDKSGAPLLRYGQDGFVAAIGHSHGFKSVAAGFPIEYVTDPDARRGIFQVFMNYLYQP
ncbi:MAG: hypothetical protein J6Z12_01325 [Paludibacteraceae bacterium]|nr:hypothetical protein [Paludibacteraceae bacterium]